MKIGYVTIKQADDLLKYNLRKGKWKNTPSYPKLTGIIQLVSSSDQIIGSGTLFTSQLEVGDWIVLDEFLVQVIAITDDLNLTISEKITTSGDLQAELLSSVEAGEYSEIISEKISYLSYAYDLLIYSKFYTLPSETDRTDQEYYTLQKAQAILAAYTLNNPEPNRHLKNQNLGISSESIGDTSVNYNTSGGGKIGSVNQFPAEVQNILNIFENRNKTYRLHRRGMEQNTTEVYYPRGPGWTF